MAIGWGGWWVKMLFKTHASTLATPLYAFSRARTRRLLIPQKRRWYMQTPSKMLSCTTGSVIARSIAGRRKREHVTSSGSAWGHRSPWSLRIHDPDACLVFVVVEVVVEGVQVAMVSCWQGRLQRRRHGFAVTRKVHQLASALA